MQMYFHRKRPRIVRGTYPNSIQFKFHAKQSTLKIDDFLDFSKNPKISDSGSAPAPPRAARSSFAVRPSRRAAQTHHPASPQHPPVQLWCPWGGLAALWDALVASMARDKKCQKVLKIDKSLHRMIKIHKKSYTSKKHKTIYNHDQ